MQVNAIINSTAANNKKITTTITYLRSSQKSKASQLAQTLNALTTNIYQSTQVNEINIDTATTQYLPQEISITYVAGDFIRYTVHRLGTGRISVYYSGAEVSVDQSTGAFVSTGSGPFTILVDSDGTYAQGFLIYTRS